MDGRRGYLPKDLLSFAHTDQAPFRDLKWSVQGLLNLCDNGPKDGGLVIVPDIHKIHHEFFMNLGKGDLKGDWYKFTEEEKKDPVFRNAIKVCGKAGDLMLFDSRTSIVILSLRRKTLELVSISARFPKKWSWIILESIDMMPGLIRDAAATTQGMGLECSRLFPKEQMRILRRLSQQFL